MSDAYTKTVLTVIAVCLIVLVTRSFSSPAPLVGSGPVSTPTHVVLDKVSDYAFSYTRPVPVTNVPITSLK